MCNDDEPIDVDLFVRSEDFERVLAAFVADTSLTITPLVAIVKGGAAQTSAHDCVERVFSVEGLCEWPVQLIEIEREPIEQVAAFDAPCNMLFVPLWDGRMEPDVQSLHEHAVDHATRQIWAENPLARESEWTLNKRAEKFAARGYEVRRCERPAKSPGLDPLDLLDALEGLGL